MHREQLARPHRQRALHDQLGRPPHAREERSGAAGPAIFHEAGRVNRTPSNWRGEQEPVQSGLAPAALTTLAHFSVSSARSLPYAAGDPCSTVEPKSANLALSLGSASPALISLLSLSTISVGVPLGAPIPLTELDS